MKPKGLGIVTTQAAPQAIGPYSQAVVVDATVYTAGQIALDPQTGEVVGKTAAEQTERSEEHTSELQSLAYLVCRLLLEKKKHIDYINRTSVRQHRLYELT